MPSFLVVIYAREILSRWWRMTAVSKSFVFISIAFCDRRSWTARCPGEKKKKRRRSRKANRPIFYFKILRKPKMILCCMDWYSRRCQPISRKRLIRTDSWIYCARPSNQLKSILRLKHTSFAFHSRLHMDSSSCNAGIITWMCDSIKSAQSVSGVDFKFNTRP